MFFIKLKIQHLPYESRYYDRQTFSPILNDFDNSCGFWQIIFAISVLFAISERQLPVRSDEAKWIARFLYSDYQDNKEGGLRRTVLCQSFPHHDWAFFGNSNVDVVSSVSLKNLFSQTHICTVGASTHRN